MSATNMIPIAPSLAASSDNNLLDRLPWLSREPNRIVRVQNGNSEALRRAYPDSAAPFVPSEAMDTTHPYVDLKGPGPFHRDVQTLVPILPESQESKLMCFGEFSLEKNSFVVLHATHNS